MEMTAKRRGLGRGLGALIPGAYSEPQASGAPEVIRVATVSIQANRFQPRQTFSNEGIEELAESIRQNGILQPLLVRPCGEGYELIAGERRLRAARQIGLEQVPVSVRNVGDAEMLEMALIENIQRENLNPIEEALAYRQLMDVFQLSQEDIATRVSKDRSTIANTLRLLQLPDEIRAEIERGNLSAGHARALVSLGSEQSRLELARHVIARRLSVRETERLARTRATREVDVEQRHVENTLTAALGTKVRILSSRGGAGRIEIRYFSLDHLNGIIDLLTGTRTGQVTAAPSSFDNP
jgi:ParB family chromosome partitioning protein